MQDISYLINFFITWRYHFVLWPCQRNRNTTQQITSPNNNHPKMDGAILLDSLIPGYSLFSRLLFETLGFDVSQLIPLLALCFALFKSGDYVYYSTRRLILRYCTCSILIASDIDAYYSMRDWLIDKKDFAHRCAELEALSIRRSTIESSLASHRRDASQNFARSSSRRKSLKNMSRSLTRSSHFGIRIDCLYGIGGENAARPLHRGLI